MLRGLIYAIGSLISRGIGDFLIQRSVRKIGDLDSLLFVTLFGAIVLSPFAIYAMTTTPLQGINWLFLASIGVFGIISALVNFEALKEGKLSVVEPIITIEIPVAILFAWIFLQQHLTREQISMILMLMVGITLLVFKKQKVAQKTIEKGIFWGIATGILLGGSNFLIGYGAGTINPWLTLRMTYMVMCVIMFAILIYTKKLSAATRQIKKHFRLLCMTAAFDNIGRIFYSLAATLLPIGIVLGLSEGYVALASLLGLRYNKEKLNNRQKIGLVIAIVAAILLAKYA